MIVFAALALTALLSSCGKGARKEGPRAPSGEAREDPQWPDRAYDPAYAAGVTDGDGFPIRPPKMGEEEGRIVRLLIAMPSWDSVGYGQAEAEAITKIEQAVREIASYDIDTIRRGLAYYCLVGYIRERNAIHDRECKTFVLNKFLFDLPARVRRDSPHYETFGGVFGEPVSGESGNPKPSDEVSLRWPWSEGQTGTWHLGTYRGGGTGEQYQPMIAFDYYRKHFGKRDMTRENPEGRDRKEKAGKESF